MRNNSNPKRTEAILSLLITTALVITLAVAVASAIRRVSYSDDSNNYIDLNETQSNLQLQNTDISDDSDTDEKSNPDSAAIISSEGNTVRGNSALDQIDEDDDYDDVKSSQMASSDTAVTSDSTDGSLLPVTSSNTDTGYSFGPYNTLKLPIDGEIILEYNMDNTIYFPTLNVYKCNPGIYIAGNVGDNVYAAATGTVSSISYDEEMGCTVTINLGDGYTASYGQIDDLRVNEGEIVLGGAIIGTVATPSIYYTIEGSGVYFELTHNGEPENPLLYTE